MDAMEQALQQGIEIDRYERTRASDLPNGAIMPFVRASTHEVFERTVASVTTETVRDRRYICIEYSGGDCHRINAADRVYYRKDW